ncbi:MAG: phosphatidate cytidylyltransferase [Clostridia bacterium]|nr:phosphatidate cytidylyltransferase [Clostridia bacterium]
MKKKVITGVIGALFGITMMTLQFTPVFLVVLAFFTFRANYELLRAAGVQNKVIVAVTSVPATAMPFVLSYDLTRFAPLPLVALLMIYVFLLLTLMLAMYEKTRFDHISMALVSSLLVPYVMSLLVEIRDFYPDAPRSTRAYMIVFTLICAWVTDAMAYFVGSKFGKHKMAPLISPKKSWEGAVGGVLGTVIINLIVYGVYFGLYKLGWINRLLFPLWLVPILSALLSVIGMLGDLSASVIKRNYGIKDYGTVMGEGNGGVMDRFDSAIFVIGAMYVLLLVVRVTGLHV